MDPWLRVAAETGNTDAFHDQIEKDPCILERIDKIPFVQTPLHVAANQGHIRFAMEMMNLKPSFAKKLNPQGLSPMHLAVKAGQDRLVLRLLKADKQLVCVKGWEGWTPFHYVVTTGNLSLLVNFLETSPECIEDVTVGDETAFHLALKHNQIEAFNILIGWLQRTRRTHGTVLEFERKMANWEDDEGNTLLHIAAEKKQNAALKLLLDSRLGLHVKAKNSAGSTALEIMKGQVKNINRTENDEVDTKIKKLKDKVIFERVTALVDRTRSSVSVDMINTMLVIMALVITATYTSSLSPPGGVWQDNGTDDTSSNITQKYHLSSKSFVNSSMWIFGNKRERAGTTVMNPQIYGVFWILNRASFAFSEYATVFLISRFHVFLILVIPVYLLALSYFCSWTILAPTIPWALTNIFFLSFYGFLPFILFFAFLIFSKSVRQTIAEIRYRTRMRQALGMNILGARPLMFCLENILDSTFSVWMSSA